MGNNCKGFYWNLKETYINPDCLKGVETIIHLAGASVSKRWTPQYKKEILASRVNSANLLYETLQESDHQVNHFISASAIGVYPSSLINYYDEDEAAVGESFLAQVVKTWETEVGKINDLNISVAKVRIGLVLSNRGGALPKMIVPFKLGLGSALGNGCQWQSWVHVEDLSNIFIHISKYKLNGVYNGVAPNPVTNNEFSKTLAHAINRPFWLPNIPRFVLRLLLGEMHEILFLSQRVSSKKIEDSGYFFKFNQLKSALKDLFV